jgi:hypothetical protein
MTVSHERRPGAEEPRAGESAQRLYEQERKAWIGRNRRVFLALDLITAVVIVGSLIVWRVWSPAGWYAGLFAGMALTFNLSARLNPPAWIEQWQAGYIGEQRTARELSKLPSDWLVLHDLPRSNGTNIDHVLVGPTGVFLLDTKNVGTEVRVEDDTLVALRPDGRERYRTAKPASSVRGAAAHLSEALTNAGAGCWVNAIIVVWGDMPQQRVGTRKLEWIAGSSVVDWLVNLPAARNPDKIARARAALTGETLKL